MMSSAIFQSLRGLPARVGDIILPRACEGCGVPVAPETSDLCSACWLKLSALVGGEYCRTCGDARGPHILIDGLCVGCRKKRTSPRFARFVRVGPYDGPLRAMILRFKREFRLGRLLGGMMADAIEGRMETDKIDLWTPVPSHWIRRMRRGFQPTAILLDHLLKRFGKKCDGPVLRMRKYVPMFHAKMPAPQRSIAIRGAFGVVRGVDVRDRSVCIIDDVANTGATLAEAKRTLKLAGARHVYAAVIAKTGRVPVERIDHAGAPNSYAEESEQ